MWLQSCCYTRAVSIFVIANGANVARERARWHGPNRVGTSSLPGDAKLEGFSGVTNPPAGRVRRLSKVLRGSSLLGSGGDRHLPGRIGSGGFQI